jgi:CspA family cold shock protein
MPQGKIKRLTDRGFGFIETADKKDMFFHMSTLLNAQWDDLREGQTVEFEVGEGPKGPRAEQVKVLDNQ